MKELFDAIVAGAAYADGIVADRLYVGLRKHEDGLYEAAIVVGSVDDVSAFVSRRCDAPDMALRSLADAIRDKCEKKAAAIVGRAAAFNHLACALRIAAGAS